MLNFIPAIAIMPRIQTQLKSIGIKAININSIRPNVRNKTTATSIEMIHAILLKSSLTIFVRRCVKNWRSSTTASLSFSSAAITCCLFSCGTFKRFTTDACPSFSVMKSSKYFVRTFCRLCLSTTEYSLFIKWLKFDMVVALKPMPAACSDISEMNVCFLYGVQ